MSNIFITPKEARLLTGKSTTSIRNFYKKYESTEYVRNNKGSIQISLSLIQGQMKIVDNELLESIIEAFNLSKEIIGQAIFTEEQKDSKKDESNEYISKDEHIKSLQETISHLRHQLTLQTEISQKLVENESSLIHRQKETNYILGRELGKNINEMKNIQDVNEENE